MNQTIYHEVLVNLLRPYPDYRNPEWLVEESDKIVLKIKAAIANLDLDLPPGWEIEVEE